MPDKQSTPVKLSKYGIEAGDDIKSVKPKPNRTNLTGNRYARNRRRQSADNDANRSAGMSQQSYAEIGDRERGVAPIEIAEQHASPPEASIVA